MTASHAAKQDARLKIVSAELMDLSMKLLRESLFTTRTDVAVATALVLAFSECWLSHIYTGIMHLRGARGFIIRGLQQQESTCMNSEELARINFLRSTWVYMDIIARLTAINGDDPEDLDNIAMPPYGPDTCEHEIDPLMGCATTLFPLIGAVANLIRQVRKTSVNSRRVVSSAAGLKDAILRWRIPPGFKAPQDETLEVDHSRHTAEAYRWATLLYLYQAVPLICSEEPVILAARVLDHLCAIPTSSRSIILHIFPLLVAGCEAVSPEDRCFVEERWMAMMARMWIGNIDRCWDVVKEVWDRRDRAVPGHFLSHSSDLFERPQGFPQWEALGADDFVADSPLHQSRDLSSSARAVPVFSSVDGTKMPSNVHVHIDPEMTVRGSLHWVAVMTERKWERK